MPHVEAVVLAGGRGTRLSGALPGVAKVLAPVKGRPFLDYVLDYLVHQGARHIVLSVGHLREQVIDKYRDFVAATLHFSPELEPLGTGGAVRLALNLVASDPFIVVNGDSLCRVDLANLLLVHRRQSAQATVAVVRPDSRADVGNVWLNNDSLVLAFDEKSSSRPRVATAGRFLNAGVYAFSKSAFAGFEAPCFSLEFDLLPKLVGDRRCYGVVTVGSLVDIGTPERLAYAQRDL
jgi:NDP-sugar pyrophosphorylase family protein